jgi:chemotaxis protein methyltransferase CheR
MKDEECVRFLQEILPQLKLRWPGFRKVRRQVCKRLTRRLADLALPDLPAYRRFLAAHPEEWDVLDSLARIGISRFCRDRGIFEELAREVLPEIVHRARERGGPIRIWSAGCASGEEPYTLALLWLFRCRDRTGLELAIIATDLDPVLLARARTPCYPESSLKELPRQWLAAAFQRQEDRLCLQPAFKAGVEFRQQDLRAEAPPGPFHLVACRNLAFTYFAEPLQKEVLARIAESLAPEGFLMIGGKESLPAGQKLFAPFLGKRGLFRKI